nr:MAG TPA: hypothetical protein [Caudoviricetes sp.]
MKGFQINLLSNSAGILQLCCLEYFCLPEVRSPSGRHFFLLGELWKKQDL